MGLDQIPGSSEVAFLQSGFRFVHVSGVEIFLSLLTRFRDARGCHQRTDRDRKQQQNRRGGQARDQRISPHPFLQGLPGTTGPS